jgi:hypothetical protein
MRWWMVIFKMTIAVAATIIAAYVAWHEWKYAYNHTNCLHNNARWGDASNGRRRAETAVRALGHAGRS